MKLEIKADLRLAPALVKTRELLDNLGIKPDWITVAPGRATIRSWDWDGAALEDPDEIEIIQLVGAG